MSTHKERIRAVLKGERADRVPVSLWRHFYDKESSSSGLAEAMTAFQKKYDWDFMKVNPRASYHIEGWGAKVAFSRNPGIKTKVVEHPVKKTEDWKKLKVLKSSVKALAEQLKALKLIKKRSQDEIFIVETVFTPLSIAGDLVKEEKHLLSDLRKKPELIHTALEIITETFSGFAVECLNAGADGIFFATTEWATKNLLTEEEYLEFGRAYDLKVLNKVKSAEFNIMHVCKSYNFLGLFSGYPVKVVNWDSSDPTNLNLKEGAKVLHKTVMGGIDRENLLVKGTPEKVSEKIKQSVSLNQKLRLILGPGCVIFPQTPEENIKAVRDAVENSVSMP
jgi:uroporphyrinogen decarboxylase